MAIKGAVDAGRDSWSMDSGSSVRLANDSRILRNAVDCGQACRAANGGDVHVSKAGTVMPRTIVDGSEVAIDVAEVYYADNPMNSIISYGRFEDLSAC
ncbi:hypothetical protein PC129_g16150 [Phytophthora cactorum]|uniref:Uncharacterized protein n=1 Tax=Phytophthora cactorum TaxID=29920 RepID=A0A329SHP0_9STRA|nr:hypothetical protein Pcac1_g4786 [Phytophthora cactorum]KAG2807915.1 hypothetical protein PC112_g17197 [Phytophthora cactorum]KAG2808449.1 hypothetical protein PC111_g16481 [Phytophthora cactorum]KAG2856217.1 hypothetical protein PC113_g11758 [Phytophthora cactorum]KAG2886469.1 hypothetical protein PC114_g19243 [Phytophthora cactorum]